MIKASSLGIKEANELTVNDDKAPRPTNVFMFGAPLKAKQGEKKKKMQQSILQANLVIRGAPIINFY
jgi:hypothetical protein